MELFIIVLVVVIVIIIISRGRLTVEIVTVAAVETVTAVIVAVEAVGFEGEWLRMPGQSRNKTRLHSGNQYVFQMCFWNV